MNLILDLFFPKKCVGCGKFGEYFCGDCISNIKQADLVCPKCERLAVGGQTHPVCKRKLGLDGLWSLGNYSNPLKEAIKQLKYHLVRQIAEVLVGILIEYWVRYQPFFIEQIKKDHGQNWLIIPVPLHWWRENDRGFNQSSSLGQLLSKKLGLDYYEGLRRLRYTKSQARLKGLDRYQNIKNAFEINPKYKLPIGCSVILLDDVWTTGSTIKECCYVLKRAGAKRVWALTLAR